MATGSTSKSLNPSSNNQKVTSSNPLDNNIEPFVPKRDHNPRDLRSWAKRTGFVSFFSGETSASISTTINSRNVEGRGILGRDKSSNIENLGKSRVEKESEIQRFGNDNGNRNANVVGPLNEEMRYRNANSIEGNNNNNNSNNNNDNSNNVNNVSDEFKNEDYNEENEVDLYGKSPKPEDPMLGGKPRGFKVKCGVLDNPGFVPVIYYGIQHYFSLAGSLILIPLIMVPAMGGTDKDTSNVMSTTLLVSGITTLLHSFFGTRLPLVQGSSSVYLAPALVIMNSEEFRNLSQHKFRHTMKELQGAIIIGSLFQSILGFSGLMSLLLRLINPVVVAPTIAALGLAFFNYGFPQAGGCVEISIPQILLVLFFTLYIRGVSISGHRVFQIYAVPLSMVIVWAYAFFLTVGGAYNFKGCSPNIPSSNILGNTCIKHAYTMKHCRTDVSDAWSSSAWVRIPYPLQWGIPIFRFRTSIIMIFVSLVSSVDSVAAYYSSSFQVNSKPPTPGIVSRGIGMEGFCSLVAGLWGTGTGSTTLTENVYTISITEVANRRGIQLGAVLLILLSFIGKVGGILASIPLAVAASMLCFIWALVIALGLLNLQYTQASSFRNLGIVGISLFLGLSIPAYFQQFQPELNLILPNYLIPYATASNGPVHTGNKQFDFATNALLSMNMVVSFLIAVVLDNTVPGSKQERGVYKWSTSEDLATDVYSQASYKLPSAVATACCWAKCLGV